MNNLKKIESKNDQKPNNPRSFEEKKRNNNEMNTENMIRKPSQPALLKLYPNPSDLKDEVLISNVKEIAKTKHSHIFKGSHKGKRVCIKRFLKNNTDYAYDRGKKLGENEIAILKILNEAPCLSKNKNFLRMLFSSPELSDPNYSMNIVLEYGGETLSEYLDKGKKFLQEEIENFLVQMINLFSHFESIGIFYRDIKAENIMVVKNKEENKLVYKLIDFDVSLAFGKDSIHEKGKDFYLIGLAGTPSKMPPELFSIYQKLLKMKKANQLNFMVFSDQNVELCVPAERTIEVDDENTLKLSINELEVAKNLKAQAIEAYKMDVFSLGFVVIEMVFGNQKIKKKKINQSPTALHTILVEFNKVCPKLFHVVHRMLRWNLEKRPDFLDLYDIFAYKFGLGDKLSLNLEGNMFISVKTFISDVWNAKNNKAALQAAFFSEGYLVQKVDLKFITCILQNHFKGNNDIHAEFLHFMKRKYQELYKTIKTGEKAIKTLIKFYTETSYFYVDLNHALGLNKVPDVQSFLVSFMLCKNDLRKPIEVSVVYRVISLKDASTTRRKYMIAGAEFFWPSFTSTSRSEKAMTDWILNAKDKEIIIFVIRIDNTNLSNKADIDKYSKYKEGEILLYPYFFFRVMKPAQPKKYQNKIVCEVELQEIPTKVMDIRIIWCDPLIANKENSQTIKNILKKSGKILRPFSDAKLARNYVKESQKVMILIWGDENEALFQELMKEEKVVSIVIYLRDKGKAKEARSWLKKEKKKFEKSPSKIKKVLGENKNDALLKFLNEKENLDKVLGVAESENELLMYLPDKSIMY